VKPARKPRDLESDLMQGCGVIVLISLVTFGLAVWPSLVWREYSVRELLTTLGCAWTPTLILGWFSLKKFRESGLAGFIGGAMCYGIFLYMRLMQVFVAEDNPDLPHAEWPRVFSIVIPALWAVLSVGLAAVAYPRTRETP
jgi:hypothetical protein